MSWVRPVGFSDDKIQAALSQPCVCCVARAGEECRDEDGRLLMDTVGRPIHIRRLDA